MYNFKYSL